MRQCQFQSDWDKSLGKPKACDRARLVFHTLPHWKERLSDIQKIIAVLAIERHARPNSGMTEEIIADDR